MNNNIASNLPPTVYQYLQKYGSMKWSVQTERHKLYDNVIVVPAVAEYDNINNLLNSLRKNDRKYFSNTLVLFVINNGESASDDLIFNNSQTIFLLNNLIGKDQLNIGIVDASSQSLCLPDKDAGVGLARKIGMDLALSLFNFASPAKKLLICLDADCELQNNYLAAIVDYFNQNRINAAVVEYEHQLPEDELAKSAIISYEIFLRYYVQGLAYAKSPYAFHTIGSTMICDVESYIKLGGMNKRKAAEDFYFLEKLAKVVNIYKISQTKVYPSSRTSWRVPFGTGQRMNRFLAGTHDEFSLFDLQIFDLLKKWNESYYSSNIYSAKEFLTIAEKIDPAIKKFLVLNSFEEQWEKILSNSKSEVQIQKQKKIWFDAFRTLKLIHYLRDNVFPNINMFDALDTFFEKINFSTNLSRKEFIPSVEVQYQYLELLKKAEVITLKAK
ncbi:MAG: glycosyltransferase family A protein [Bacteroidota bacterium]